jgi:CubicO group peptidase (beta-lactamase class C family)
MGTWSWGGVWGHSWFVDPAHDLTVALLTNTAIEGMLGPTTFEVRDAVYASF